MQSVLVTTMVDDTLETLTLDAVTFAGHNAVNLLLPIVSLCTLNICKVRFKSSPNEEKDGEGDDEDVSCVWKELLERSPRLQTVSIDTIHHACFTGVIEGASCHENVESFALRRDPEIKE